MTLPMEKDVELPLLIEIEAMGGEARPQDIYPRVTGHFPQVTEADLGETISHGMNKWTNRIQWARQNLVIKKELERYPRGVWRITDKGRERLRSGGLLGGKVVVEGQEAVRGGVVTPPTRHDDLKQKMVDIGNRLRYNTSTEETCVGYRHDVLWKPGPYKRDPSHVIEICDGGSLPKDFDALSVANRELGAKGILVTVDDTDYVKAKQRFENQSDIAVVKAETVDKLHELMMTDLEFLRSIFSG